VAAAIASTSRQVGSSLGVAVIGAAVAAGMRTGAWWIIAGCGVAVLVLGALTTGRWASRTAERAAARLDHSGDRVPVSVR
jgi:uncharacterized membrane protein